MRTGGGTNAGGSFIKTGGGTLRILVGNNQQDDPLLLNGGTIIAEHADALGRGDTGVRVDMKGGTTLVLRNDAGTNFQTPINAVDTGQTIDVVIDRQTAGLGVTHTLNALTSSGAFTLNVSAGANVTGGTPGLALGGGTLGGNGTVDVGANALVAFTPGVTTTGIIGGGAFGLTKAGAGTLLLNVVNTYTGATTVNAGALAGNGTIAGNVSNGAFVRPGASPGLLSISGNYTQTATGALDVELNGLTAGTQYDRLAAAGTITLAGQLNVSLGFAAASGDSFVLIDNAGTDAVVGTFTGLAEGAMLLSGGRALRISYVGGDGNDVTLTVTPPPTVTDVFVSGPGWTSNFLNYLATSGVGDATYGYRLDATAHADELPWVN
jgi:autotransporter-associated beta strand protein